MYRYVKDVENLGYTIKYKKSLNRYRQGFFSVEVFHNEELIFNCSSDTLTTSWKALKYNMRPIILGLINGHIKEENKIIFA